MKLKDWRTQQLKRWRHGSGKNCSPNVLGSARSWCMKRRRLAAFIAAGSEGEWLAIQLILRPLHSRRAGFDSPLVEAQMSKRFITSMTLHARRELLRQPVVNCSPRAM